MSSVEMEQLKTVIKKWEYSFREKNDRLPSKLDIKANADIHKLYLKYRALKSGGHSSHSKRNVSSGFKAAQPVHNSPPPETSDERGVEIMLESEIAEYENEDIESDLIPTVRELGPTPQANGKVLSIFDMRMTPPESSPLKSRQTSANPFTEFKTPTKVRVKHELRNTPTRTDRGKELIFNKLKNLSTENNHLETPKKKETQLGIDTQLVTPMYLGRTNKKFEFANGTSIIDSNENISSSPFVVQEMTPRVTVEVTPTRNPVIDFLVSPSPLKSHRFFTKKLTDVFHEIKAMENSDELEIEENEEEDIHEDIDNDNDGNQKPRRKKFTMKRTTRRWKMKPTIQANVDGDSIAKKNIHDEIKKLDDKQKTDLEAYMASDDESEEEPIIVKKAKPQSGAKKIKPMSNNYQRLKINDPRSKAFKRRMSRR